MTVKNPKQEKIRVLLSNSLVLSVLPALLIILLLPLNWERFYLEEVSSRLIQPGRVDFYEDLNGDGHSEKISIGGEQTRSGIIVQNRMGQTLSQWNFRGEANFLPRKRFWVANDFLGWGKKQLFTFSLSNDSILLHGLFDLQEEELAISNRFIASVGQGIDGHDVFILPLEPEDLNGDGVRELLFGISAGHSIYPRQIYAYFIEQDSLIVSPPSSYKLYVAAQADLTGNGKREIILHGGATGNVRDPGTVFHDHSNWLMVLNQDLEFLFEPVEIPGRHSSFHPFVVGKGGQKYLVGINGQNQDQQHPEVFTFSSQGEVLAKKQLTIPIGHICLLYTRRSHPEFAVSTLDDELRIYDADMQLKRTFPGKSFNHSISADLDRSGQKEIIAAHMQTGQVHVFQTGFEKPVSASVEWTTHLQPLISINERGDLPPQVSFQLGNRHYLFEYGRNRMYLMNILACLGAYLAVFLFTHGIRRMQKKQMDREQQTEKQITELQLTLVKAQLDPHFSLNALNSVMGAVRNNQPELAEAGLLRFATLYRSMLLSAGDIRRSLEEELRFTENYLELEKMRFGDNFEYEITTGHGTDPTTLVPKLIVQIHAENAVKHGLAPRRGGGRLKIHAEVSGDQLHIRVEDNGVGRAHPTTKQKGNFPVSDESKKGPGHDFEKTITSTGRGLALMEEFYDLYRKFYHQTIGSEITDLVDSAGNPAGTVVSITIHLSNE